MNIIEKIAKSFIETNIETGVSKYEKIIEEAKKQIIDIDSTIDKVTFLHLVLEANNLHHISHKLGCKEVEENCPAELWYGSINYFLTQELNRLGVRFEEDAFSTEEKNNTEYKLNKILSEIEELKLGNQIIYDDLLNEINELRALYFLGKKNWRQLLLGKCFEMTVSGIISETISKNIVETVKPTILSTIS